MNEPAPALCGSSVPAGTQARATLPSIEVSRCDGTKVNLRSYACGGELTLLNLCAGAYRACQEKTRVYALDEEWLGLQQRGLQIVQVFALDDQLMRPSQSYCSEYTGQNPTPFPVLIDPDGETQSLASQLPVDFVVEGDAVITARWDEEEDELSQILADILDGRL